MMTATNAVGTVLQESAGYTIAAALLVTSVTMETTAQTCVLPVAMELVNKTVDIA